MHSSRIVTPSGEKIAAASVLVKVQQLEFVCVQYRQPRQQAQSRPLWPELLILKRRGRHPLRVVEELMLLWHHADSTIQ